MQTITLEQFQQELGQVDFYYQYLDDFQQYQTASNHFHKVLQISKTNTEFKKLFDLRNPFNKSSNNN